jgi:hypothetical protein
LLHVWLKGVDLAPTKYRQDGGQPSTITMTITTHLNSERKLELKCYFQGCKEYGVTKEHIPPRAFFPDGETLQLLTVKSCPTHNNAKSQNDLYVLAQICMNASPSNRAREVFQDRVAPQLSYNNDALRRMLLRGSVPANGGVAYAVDTARFDDFFTALSFGLIYKSQKAQLPLDYRVGHIYHGFISENAEMNAFASAIDAFYAEKPLAVMSFGKPDTRNERIYTCEIHGLPDFQGSITIVHKFFGNFKVTSMLTKLVSFDGGIPSVPES